VHVAALRPGESDIDQTFCVLGGRVGVGGGQSVIVAAHYQAKVLPWSPDFGVSKNATII